MSVRHASKSVVDALPLSRSSNYVCRQCRRNAHPSQILLQQRQYASDRNGELPLAERVRRKLWKGKPPGPENVDELYGGPGALETMFKERRERRARTKYADEPAEPQASTDASQKDAHPMETVLEQKYVKRELRQPGSARPVQDKTMAAPVEPVVPRAPRQPAQPQLESEPELKGTVPAQVDEYKQATTWDGLRIIGHKGHWKEMSIRAQDEYQPWLVASQVRKEWSFSELVCLMHQAIVDCHVARKSNVPFEELSQLNSQSLVETTQELQDATFELSTNGTITAVRGLSEFAGIPESCYYSELPAPINTSNLSQEEQEAIIERTQPPMVSLRPRHLYTPTDTSFLDTKLIITNTLTFNILKRFARLTNHTIPDPLISDLNSADPTRNTIRTFLTNMAEKTKNKPAKIAEQLLNNEALAQQGNLLILGRRETPVDKEKEVGRWKVIEEELRSRGLPVLGRAEVQR